MKKKVIVNRKFLTDLAKKIYDSKTRKFLHLCEGKLQNGPDPTDPKRPMHCGLGELYYAMTGRQPNSDMISISGVIELAADLCTLPKFNDVFGEEAPIQRFKDILNEIPDENDDGCGNFCDRNLFRNRSKRVAAKLREAAKLLPK